jgi:protein involved in polysaccharide export with SLBB domain
MRVRDLVPSSQALIDTFDYWQNSPAGNLTTGINWGYANVVRLQATDLTRSMLSIDLGKALMPNDTTNNIALLPGDELTIFTNDEIQVPAEKRNRFVRLEGEVMHPGLYQVQAGETLRQLVLRVGGVSDHAYLFGSEFSRESTRKMQQARLEEIIARMEADVQRNAVQSATAGLNKDDAALSQLQAQSQQSLIAKMRQVKATGRIVLEMPDYAVELKNLPELALEDGDRFFVPIAPSTVSVMGTVYNQNAFIYRKGQNVSDYLEKSGGPTRDGDKDDVYLIRADGQVFSKRQSGYVFGNGGFSGRVAMPGDVVVVPEKLDKYNLTKDIKDWTQIFYQFAFGIAAFKTIGAF